MVVEGSVGDMTCSARSSVTTMNVSEQAMRWEARSGSLAQREK